MSDLKKLNNAIAGIDDGLLADAMSSSETKQSGGRLRAVLGAVASTPHTAMSRHRSSCQWAPRGRSKR